MYITPEQAQLAADVLEEHGHEEVGEVASALKIAAEQALARYGEKRAGVSIDASGARGYAL